MEVKVCEQNQEAINIRKQLQQVLGWFMDAHLSHIHYSIK